MGKVGLSMFVTSYSLDVVTLAREAERLGFDSLWLPEHPVIPEKVETPFLSGGPIPEFYRHTIDPFVGLAAAAAATKTLLLGNGICLLPERNPLFTAKEAATVDLISGGRYQLGIGAGWLREESELLGVDFPHRWSQTRDFALALKALWSDKPTAYEGKYIKFPPLWCEPNPVQRPHPPIHIAGELKYAAQRVAEYGDGWFPRGPNALPPAVEEGRKRIEGLLRERGRAPSALTVSIYRSDPDKTLIHSYFDAGADRVILILPSQPGEKVLPLMEQWAAQLL